MAGACTPSSATVDPVDDELGNHYRLDNGLEVVLLVDRRLPLVAVDLSYHVGSMHDGPRRGLAHLAEHLMFRGTTDIPDGQFRARLADAGAVGVNARTRAVDTSYHMLVSPEQLPVVMWLESDRMANLAGAVDAVVVGEERQTTIDEWEQRIESEQFGAIELAANDAMFPEGHPHHRARPAAIARLSLADVRAFSTRYYGPANATLVLVGDLPEDVHAQIQRYFGFREGGEHPPPPNFEIEALTTGNCDVRHPSAGTASVVWMAWPSPGRFEAGDAEADILADILQTERIGMLDASFQDSPPALAAMQRSQVEQSIFILAARFDTAPMQQVIETLDRTMQDLRTNPPKPEEIERARLRLHTRGVMREATFEGRAALVQSYLAHGKPPDWLDQDLARYDSVDASSLAFFQARTLTKARRTLCTFARSAE